MRYILSLMYMKCIIIIHYISGTVRFRVTFSNIHIDDPSLQTLPNPGQALLLLAGGVTLQHLLQIPKGTL